MSFIHINKKVVSANTNTLALFNLGFRPFFLGAAIFACLSIAMWILIYFSHITLPLRSLSSLQWHSHEMIYGYSLAVIAGFLLTAVMNWTGIQTIHGKSLIALFSLWLFARILFLFGAVFLEIAAIVDMLFMLFLFVAVLSPILKARQWGQLGIASKILLLTLGNLFFYLGAFGLHDKGVYWGIYGGLYAIVALILTIGARVFPGFVRNGVDYEVEISNPRWMVVVNLVLFILFSINQLFIQSQAALGYFSITLFLVNSVRLLLWHTPGIWKKPLLWSLYLSFIFIDIGFLLFAWTAFSGVSPFLAIHAFAFGGIGLATMGMMARVALGHTGRSISNPSRPTTYALVVLVIGAVIRIGFALIDQSQIYYGYWILSSQVCWIIAFALFFVSYSKMLIQPSVTDTTD